MWKGEHQLAMRIITRIFLPIGLLLTVGCGTSQVGKRYYVARATVKKVVPEQPPDDIREEVSAAGEILKNGTATVGFFPSNNCRKATAPTTQATGLQTLTPECAMLLPILEEQAEEQGYNVVRWTRFGTNPWIAAKEMNLDVLFIVDDVTLTWSTNPLAQSPLQLRAKVEYNGLHIQAPGGMTRTQPPTSRTCAIKDA